MRRRHGQQAAWGKRDVLSSFLRISSRERSPRAGLAGRAITLSRLARPEASRMQRVADFEYFA